MQTTQSNNVKCNISWNNYSTPTNLGDVNLVTNFKDYSKQNPSVKVDIFPSALVINDSTWKYYSFLN